MLYLLELFDNSSARNPIELNLICQFNNRDNFWAIFAGINRYKFTKVMPIVGHTYLRKILMPRDKNLIEYQITDLNEGTNEQFDFQCNPSERKVALTSFQTSNIFTGLEWWNKTGSSPFPIRYEVEVSNLMYGQHSQLRNNGGGDTTSGMDISYNPFNGLIPNQDGYAQEYPVAFAKVSLDDASDICKYAISKGVCKIGPCLEQFSK
jgi:hypothetical protein